MNDSTEIEILKGNLTPIQKTALQTIVDGLVEDARAAANRKPDTRGHYGLVTSAGGYAGSGARNSNPTAFRNSPLPRAH